MRVPLYMEKSNHVVSSYKLARDIVKSRWPSSWTDDLPCSVPRIRGFIHKTATASQSPTIGMSLGEVEQFTFEKLPIYSSCQVR